jgi:predicted transcriptional regulator
MTLPTFLGDLETAVMEHLWTEGSADVKAVHQAIGVPRQITANTVQSTMERLYRKGLLRREKISHAYVYAPQVSREEFGANLVREVVSRVLGGETEPMLSAFVDLAAGAGEEHLDRLERLVAERRAARKGGKP